MKKILNNRLFCSIIILILTGILIYISHNDNKAYSLNVNGFFFDTFISITIYSNDTTMKDSYEATLSNTLDMCKDYEKIFSYTDSTSELYSLNHSNDTSINLSIHMSNIIKESLYYSNLTKDAFDIYLGELYEMWNFNNQSVPSSDFVKTSLTNKNNNTPYLSEKVLFYNDINNKPKVHLGAIAKGYIADRIKDYLVENGVKSGLINLGGNVLTIGQKNNSDEFRIAITKPFKQDEASAYVDISDYSVVTSGIYERYFIKDDTIYHHIINPNTGYPVDNGLYSVTIISKSSTTADALSTGTFVLGLKDGLSLVNTLDDVYAVFIDESYNIILSDGLTMTEDNIITIHN